MATEEACGALSSAVCLLLIIAFTPSQAVIQLLGCEDGWGLVDASCLRVIQKDGNVVKQTWEQAEQICAQYGGHLPKIVDFYTKEEMGKIADKASITEHWTGMNRLPKHFGMSEIGLEDAFWADGEKTSVRKAFWHNDQPNPTDGNCVLSVKDTDRMKFTFKKCQMFQPVMCEINACPIDHFRCQSGLCIRNSQKCDNVNDCDDNTDELNCPDLDNCIKTFTGISGEIRTFSGQEGIATRCFWLVRGPINTNIQLNFVRLSTEENTDVIEVLVGGESEDTATLIGHYSGSKIPKPIISNNNLLIVKFSTDTTNNLFGFVANWKAVSVPESDRTQPLTASNTQMTLSSPLYEGGYLSGHQFRWLITAERRSQIITLQTDMKHMDLKGNTEVVIYDGDSVLANEITTYNRDSTGPEIIMSTGTTILIIMTTRGVERGHGITLKYIQGCYAEVSGSEGVIMTPGYPYAKYPNSAQCTWKVLSPGGDSVTLVFDDLFCVNSEDSLKISSMSGERLGGADNLAGVESPKPVLVPGGNFSVKFNSSATRTDCGFKATYSRDCQRLWFNADTDIDPSPQAVQYGVNLTITCPVGYQFNHEIYGHVNNDLVFASLDSVRMECLFGGFWSQKITPQCNPVYCGQPVDVKNGFIAHAQGTTFGKSATFECHSGFKMTGSATAVCKQSGNWSPYPTCDGTVCEALPDIDNGRLNHTAGSGTDYASLIHYTCNEGYDLMGADKLFCQSNGNWSQSVPKCEALRCAVPVIEHSMPILSPYILFDHNISVSCDMGYNRNGSQFPKCQSDQTFTTLPTCDDIDECEDTTFTHNCSGVASCKNIPGAFICECPPGYSLNASGTTCSDIDECSIDKGGCSHNCTENTPGYTCSCPAGYVLFSEDGDMGFNLSGGENGMMRNDVYHFNHTCIPKKCEHPSSVANAVLLSGKTLFHYGDTVQYFCKMGYLLNGNATLTCSDDATWTPAPPSCTLAECEQVIPRDLINLPTLSIMGNVSFGENVTLTCNIPGKPEAVIKYRFCLYDKLIDSYRLFGPDYECGVINCGLPETRAGAHTVSSAIASTTFDANFSFVCLDSFIIEGTSEANDTIVRCGSNGLWDFGTLECIGRTCTDPGTPPDGYQMATTYEVNQRVTYGCNSTGYQPDNTTPLRCLTNFTWDRPRPNCIDVQEPAFENCPKNVITINMYDAAGFDVPVPKDNTGVTSFSVHPAGFDPSLSLSSDISVIYSALDFQGNKGVCVVNITVTDPRTPTVTCRSSYLQTVQHAGENLTVNISGTENGATVSERNVFPEIFTAPAEDRWKHHKEMVTVTVYDKFRNSASCTFQVYLRAAACSEANLPQPVNADLNCTDVDGRRECSVRCNNGSGFYDAYTDETFTTSCASVTWTNNAVSVMPSCVTKDVLAEYVETYGYEYVNADGGAFPYACSSQHIARLNADPDFQLLKGAINTVCHVANVKMVLAGSFSNVTEPSKEILTVTVTYTAEGAQNGIINLACSSTMSIMQPIPYQLGSVFMKLTASSCPNVVIERPLRKISAEFSCTVGKARRVGNDTYCLLCPPGTQVLGDRCEPCPRGEWQDSQGEASCTSCPASTSTRETRSTSDSDCIVECASGFISASGLPPCQACDKDTYYHNSTSCLACADGQGTLTNAADSISKCHVFCSQGHYSVTGMSSCMPCPLHYYQNELRQKECKPCNENAYTNSTGSTDVSDCIQVEGSLCNAGTCKNGGTCNIARHGHYCTCLEGYSGQDCETELNPCSSDPCYYGSTCRNLNGTDFACDCPPITKGPIFTSCTSTATEKTRFQMFGEMPIAYDPEPLIFTLGNIATIPSGVSFETHFLENTTVKYIAYDADGTSAECVVEFIINDVTEPTIDCLPRPHFELIGEIVIVRTVIFSDVMATYVTSNMAATVEFSPRNIVVQPVDIHKVYTITATADNGEGTSTSCQFQVAIEAAPCSPISFGEPVNGRSQCNNASTSGWRCNVSCNTGYKFYGFSNTSYVSECTSSISGWSAPLRQCVDASASARFIEVFEYLADPVSPVCPEKYKQQLSTIVPGIDFVLCSAILPIDGVTINTDATQTVVRYTVQYNDDLEADRSFCSSIARLVFNKKRGNISALLNLTAPACPSLPLNYSSIVFEPGLGCVNGILQEGFCVTCGAGSYLSSLNTCIPCEVGSYTDLGGQRSCTSCGSDKSTLNTGSTDQKECIDVCPPGMTSLNGLSPCTPCPVDKYRLNTTTCQKCSSETSTLRTGSNSLSDCIGLCPKGHFSQSGLVKPVSCFKCPLHSYQSSSGQTSCILCGANEVTESEGSISAASCKSTASALCIPDICKNGGTCTPSGRGYTCSCTGLFTGRHCEIGAAYAGSRCEIERDDCNGDSCENGMCMDLERSTRCLCLPGFSGDKCSSPVPICNTHECKHGSKCEQLSSSRHYKCNCLSGYHGAFCEENIDDCESNPCFNNGNCTDLVDDFMCICPPGYSGKQCETRAEPCDSVSCGDSMAGRCYDYFHDDTGRCICNPGYISSGSSSCDIQDACSSDPCWFGVCRASVNSFTCQCEDGYDGSLCQHNIDDCMSDSCHHRGTCHDKNNTFACDCVDGFNGTRCEIDINECEANPCNTTWTVSPDGCKNLINDYECICKPGFTGKTCSSNINECASFPCQHGSSCHDADSDFTCECPSGWSGKHCEIPKNVCSVPTCADGAECIPIFDDFVCRCSGGAHGVTCATKLNNCAILKPCTPYGNCTEMGGKVKCTCADTNVDCTYNTLREKRYEAPSTGNKHGDNIRTAHECRAWCTSQSEGDCDAYSFNQNAHACETYSQDEVPPDSSLVIARDFSFNQKIECHPIKTSYTANGCHIVVDQCKENPCQNGGTCNLNSDGSFSCICPPGYSTTDDCATLENTCSRTCPITATCILGINKQFCRCPVGKSGSDCNKDLDTDYDLHFHSSLKTGQASLLYPIPNKLTAFTISFWVRYSQQGSTGTFFMAFQVSQQRSLAGKRGLFRMDDEKLTYTLFGNSGNCAHPDHNVNDGDWHNIMIMWSNVDGKLILIINTVRYTCGHYGIGGQLDPFLWVTLGNKFDIIADKPVPNEGLQGYISQVNIYNRKLNFDLDVQRLRNDSQLVIGPDSGLVLRWNEFWRYPGVSRTTATSTISASTSTARLYPVFDNCPEPIVYLGNSGERFFNVTWPNLKTKISTDIITSNQDSGEPYVLSYWARHFVIYLARNLQGNTVVCSFRVYVNNDRCIDTRGPVDGVLTCNDDHKLFKTCSLKCTTTGARPSVPIPDFFTCGPSGNFNPLDKTRPFRYPSCSAPSRPPSRVITVVLIFRPRAKCADVMDTLKRRVQDALDSLDKSGALCNSERCIKLEVIIKCIQSKRRRRRATSTDDAVIIFQPNNTSTVADGTAEDLIREAIVDTDIFSFTDEVTDASIGEDDFIITTTVVCDAGEVLRGDMCYPCGVGFKYNSATKLCEKCPIGTYQDVPGQTLCKDCPDSKTTEADGAPSSSDCVASCSAGSFYNSSSSNCEECAIGFYQAIGGQLYCEPCSFDKTTRSTGSTSQAECKADCPAGFEHSVSLDTCKPCPMGMYRELSKPPKCVHCPDYSTTSSVGAKDISECNLRNCSAGSYSNENRTACIECAKGEYQSEPNQFGCTQCPEGFSTRDTGANNISLCEEYCESGLERQSDECVKCDRGYYKNNTLDFFATCTLCPIEYITDGLNSTSLSDCKIRNCSAGTFINTSLCVDCPKGWYQPDKWKTECRECPRDKTTPDVGSANESDCIVSCPPGKEDDGSETCVLCTDGFWKDVDGATKCEACRPTFRTNKTGAISADDCNVEICSAGKKLNSSNECEPCPLGEYQPDSDKDTCEVCTSNRTTLIVGAVSRDLCVLNCGNGMRAKNNTGCDNCPRGTYGGGGSKEECDPCPEGLTTVAVGTKFEDECTVDICAPGSFSINLACDPCPIGQYQDKEMQTTCSDCPDSKTTLKTGANRSGLCITDCPVGKQYNTETTTCEACPRGMYRDKATESWESCIDCPPGKTTSDRSGAEKAEECFMSACDPGTYRDGNNCSLCPKGQYQDEKWQDSCKPCKNGHSTGNEGSTTERSCEHFCSLNICDEEKITECIQEEPYCVCKDIYEGPLCEQIKEMQKSSLPLEVIISVPSVIGLCLIILVIVLICRCVKRNKEKETEKKGYDNRYLPELVPAYYSASHAGSHNTSFVASNHPHTNVGYPYMVFDEDQHDEDEAVYTFNN